MAVKIVSLTDRAVFCRLRPGAVLMVACVLATPVPAHQAALLPAQDATIDRWIRAALEHEPGVGDAAAAWAAAMTAAEAASLFPALRSELARGAKARSGALRNLIDEWGSETTVRMVLARRGAMLHSDAAMLISPVITDPTSKHAAVLLADGRRAGTPGSSHHWEFAARTLSLLPATEGRAHDVRLWFVAAAAFLQNNPQVGGLRQHLDLALELFPSDARLLLAAGAMRERYAEAGVQDSAKSAAPPGYSLALDSPNRELRRAEASYRKAIQSGLGELTAIGHVRLGRVLALQKRNRESLVELNRGASLAQDPFVCYLAELLRGDVLLDDGRHADAVLAYERALRLYPGAQSGSLGLSAAALLSGNRSLALAEIEQHLRSTEAPVAADPFWQYHVSHIRDLAELWEQVRRLMQGGR